MKSIVIQQLFWGFSGVRGLNLTTKEAYKKNIYKKT